METRKRKSRGLLPLVAGTAMLIAAAVANAQATDNEIARLSLTPFGGYTFGGKFKDTNDIQTVEVDDAAHFGLLLNIRESANTQWEVFYSQQQSEADTAQISPSQPTVDLDIQYLHIGGTYVADGALARPFLAATVGVTRFDPQPLTFDSENFFSFAVGAGWYIQASERLDLRLEGRALGTLLGSDTALFCQTGPDDNVCAISANSDIYWQFQTSLGLVFRF